VQGGGRGWGEWLGIWGHREERGEGLGGEGGGRDGRGGGDECRREVVYVGGVRGLKKVWELVGGEREGGRGCVGEWKEWRRRRGSVGWKESGITSWVLEKGEWVPSGNNN